MIKFSFLSKEVLMAAMNLHCSFVGSRFLTDREPAEFLADEASNTYFVFGDCETKEDVDCKVLEFLSRAAFKTEPFGSPASNENFHRKMLAGINAYLGTDFSEEDMETVYMHLGNGCDHEKTVEFVRSGFDMGVFEERTEEAGK